MTVGEALKLILAGVTAYAPMPGREGANAVPPFIVYTHFGRKNYGGVSGLLTAQQPVTVQLDLYDSTYLGVEAVQTAVEAAFAPYAVNGGVGGVVPVCATQGAIRYMGEDPEVNLHRLMLEYSVWYKP